MKVHDTGRISAIQQYRKAHLDGLGKSGVRQEKDAVEISMEAKELHDLQYTTSSERLESLKKAVKTGTYHVDAQQIVEKMYPYLMRSR